MTFNLYDTGFLSQVRFDPDAVSYITAVEAADQAASPGIGLLEGQVRYAINDFVVGCKQDGIWNAIKASCILAGARTLQGALRPLVGTAPTNFNFVSGDYNRKTGLVGNGSTKYLNINRANNIDPTNNKHMAAYVTQVTSTGCYRIIMGISQNSGDSLLAHKWDCQDRIRVSLNGGATSLAEVLAPGLFGINRSSSSGYLLQRSGFNSFINSTSTNPTSSAIFLYNGSGLNGFSADRIAFYSIGESLNLTLLNTRVTDLINAFNAAI
jgi:hypothetical protein